MAGAGSSGYPEPFGWATHPEDPAHPDRTADDEASAGYVRNANRPAVGLPESVRLPAELPDNLWPPHALLERNATENIYVPVPVEVTERPPAEAVTEELPEARLYVPPPPEERQARALHGGEGHAGPLHARELQASELQAEELKAEELQADELQADDLHAGQRHAEGRHTEDRHVKDRHAEERRAEEQRADQRHDVRRGADGEHDDDREPAFLPMVLGHGEDDPEDYVPAHSRGSGARHAASGTSKRTIRRRRRAVLLAYLMVVAAVLIIGHQMRSEEQPIAPGREAAQRAAEPVGPAPADVPVATPQAQAAETQAAEVGKAGEFRYAKTRGPMLGTDGDLHRFEVAVEDSVEGTKAAEFAEEIDRTLGDERSWIHDGQLRLRRVTQESGKADFTIYLASARTSEQMCATGGLQTAGFTSCRVPGKVIINADRWAEGIPDYEGHLAEYRRYAINHEVGHELGHGHEACPGEGEKAPVMMPQTYGLKGCTRNAWPYLDGERYSGEPMA